MFSTKRILPLFLLLATCSYCSQAQAQTSVPLYTTYYSVQVEWSFWRSGGTYWSTEFESTDYQDALLVLTLFEWARDNGALSDVLDVESGATWIPIDVRMRTRYEWNIDPFAHRTAHSPVNSNLYYLRN